jgi:hypothetical protein
MLRGNIYKLQNVTIHIFSWVANCSKGSNGQLCLWHLARDGYKTARGLVTERASYENLHVLAISRPNVHTPTLLK